LTPQEVIPTLEKGIAHIEWMDYKGIYECMFYIGSLLGEAALYK
jgi:hypothetical protein